jgi:hypothetical protein
VRDCTKQNIFQNLSNMTTLYVRRWFIHQRTTSFHHTQTQLNPLLSPHHKRVQHIHDVTPHAVFSMMLIECLVPWPFPFAAQNTCPTERPMLERAPRLSKLAITGSESINGHIILNKAKRTTAAGNQSGIIPIQRGIASLGPLAPSNVPASWLDIAGKEGGLLYWMSKLSIEFGVILVVKVAEACRFECQMVRSCLRRQEY